MKTLTPVGINKQLLRLRDSLAYATFLEGGVKKKVSIFKADVEGNKIKIYVYLDDSVIGEVEDISLVDKDYRNRGPDFYQAAHQGHLFGVRLHLR